MRHDAAEAMSCRCCRFFMIFSIADDAFRYLLLCLRCLLLTLLMRRFSLMLLPLMLMPPRHFIFYADIAATPLIFHGYAMPMFTPLCR